jgi:hypothetical protein
VDDLLARLKSSTGIRKKVRFENKDSRKAEEWGTIEDEVSIISTGRGWGRAGHIVGVDYKHVIQRIRFIEGKEWDGSTYCYRMGYWSLNRAKSRISWARGNPFLSEKEYADLLSKARAKGWPIFSNLTDA